MTPRRNGLAAEISRTGPKNGAAMNQRAAHWNDRYARQDQPWDTGRPSRELCRLLEQFDVAPSRALEFGCGTGTNATYLAGQGFRVTAVDIAPVAIEAARARALQAGVEATFHVADLLTPIDEQPFWEGVPFPLVFDRGVYHALRRIDVERFTDNVRRATAPDGLYIVLAGNANESHEGEGPPRVHAAQLCDELSDGFHLVQLREFRFDSSTADGRRIRPLAWSVVLRRCGGSRPA